ncbi:hypothetical protein PCO31111_00829 [Pandoraea communis]|uniref:Putative Flp pilus-assembly TadG-like N-terminal domain-containing protein n=1 Tax=Pandoraea communis TaxID=2508297 RepID=A0A5E4SJF2_9BURK|nr:pilus assembly protein TadG-related protein [Pandoraea communis]VVD75425.1 hypothetical protein PCO31111_00829 [Pandoraea communis]
MTLRARVRKSARMTPPGGRQRGSVPILSFIFLIVVLILAFALDAGNVFMQRRNLQRAADMAALAGAQTLPGCANATSFAAVASANAKANINSTALQVASSCGIWTSPAANATGPGTFVPVTPGNAASGNAVSVTLSMAVPSFFQLVGTRTVTATAIARKAPAVVTFTVDSGLLALNTNNSVLSGILSPLGVNVQAYVASGQKLVGTTLTPSGLLQALGVPVTGDVTVASLTGLATIQNLTVGQLLSATRTAVATQSGALSASVSALDGLISVFGTSTALKLPVKLFGTATSPGVFANIDLAGVSAASALTANVNVMDLISTAIIGGNGANAISIPLNLLGVVSGQVTIVSPPQLGIGGKGTSASTAQVRIVLQISTTTSNLLGGLLNNAGTKLTLPLTVELAQSKATVTDLQCGAVPSATLEVTSGLVNLCVGADADGNTSTTSSDSCTTILTNPTPIATLLNLITVNGKTQLSLVTNTSPPPTHTFNGSFPQPWGPVGSNVDLSQIVGALLTGLTVNVGLQPISNSPGASLANITKGLLQAVPPGSELASISTVNAYLNTAAAGLQTTLSGLASTADGLLTLNGQTIASGLKSTLDGLAGTVGGILSGLVTGLTSALADGVCNISANPASCRANYINGTNIVSTSNLTSVLNSVLYTLLNPLLAPLSGLINQALAALGISLGTTTVTVDSINCQNGLVQLVY